MEAIGARQICKPHEPQLIVLSVPRILCPSPKPLLSLLASTQGGPLTEK